MGTKARIVICLAVFFFSSCSKVDENPQVFLPRVMGPEGTDLDARRAIYCNPSQVKFDEKFLTQENFNAMFRCANYDSSLNGLEPLFRSADFPNLLRSINLVLQSDNTKSIRDSLRDWLEDGPQGTSRVDRLLPFVAKLVKSPSFQDFLPVFSNILDSGREIWNDLLPGLADVVYTDLFPDNLENAFTIVSSFSSSSARSEEKDYAGAVKDFARFLKSDVDGHTASEHALELANEIRNIEIPGTSVYEFLENILEKGTISAFFLDSGAVRGEVLDPKLNEAPDAADVACPGLNETPEQRQQCAYERLFKRSVARGDAPLSQLAILVVEFQKDHSDLLPALASWFSANGPRVVSGLSGYVVRAQIVTNLSRMNVGAYLQQFAVKSGLDTAAPVSADQFGEFLGKAFVSPDFTDWLGPVVNSMNRDAFGSRNAEFLQNSSVLGQVAALYTAHEIQAFGQVVIPNGGTASLQQANRKFNNLHRRDQLVVDFQGRNQSIEKHLGDFWIAAVKNSLGEDVVLDYVTKLAQTLATQLANDFQSKGQPLAEWYFNSPYGNPGTTESLVGYALKEFDLLNKYYKNKEWLMNDFANEVFTNEADKRAFRMIVDQVPNLVLYIRSGMARSGGDLTRALARDRNGYLVKTYVNLIVKATEIGWVRKGARLIEAFQQRPGRFKRAKAFAPSDDIVDRRKYKLGVEAFERVIRSLIQPQVEGDFSTSTLGRLMRPLSSVVSEERRAESERFLLTSANELLGLSDEKINNFFRDFNEAKPPGSVSERRETYRSLAEMMRKPYCADLVRHLSGLFRENAVKPALDFFAKKIDDGSLPKVLLFIRRLLGMGK